ncbi:POT family MFS transporter [Akkermansiaceae bacterium]|nr:POT family MFS transporter [Akkermansiaceae bacterium]
MSSEYRSTPTETTGMPGGIPFIISNEAAERFSFYGMRTILVIFMTQYLWLMDGLGGEQMSKTQATAYYHDFVAWVYFTPLLGALLADVFLGKYRTIIALSLVYCAGHACLAFMGFTGVSGWWLFAGLLLITIGSGGIKPCVSAHVGDQFGKGNSHLLTKIYNWFYFSINLGSVISTLMTPWLLKWYGPHWAFGIPGVLMAIATFLFWKGRHKFIHVPPGGKKFFNEIFSKEGLAAIGKLIPLYLFIAMFWALFDQTGSSWVFQAQDMDRNFMGITWLESQIQAINPLLILTFIPLFTMVVYPSIDKVFKLTPLRKIGIGLFLAAASFALVTLVQGWIDAGERPSVAWQLTAFALLTAAEVMVSIVALEFSYTQAPRNMKSMIMAIFLLSVWAGNFLTSGINKAAFIPEATSEELASGYDELGNSGDEIKAPGKDQAHALHVFETPGLNESFKLILGSLSAKVEKSGGFPDSLDLPTDPWGNPFRYSQLNSQTARISSDGPDKTTKTKWDLNMTLSLPAPEEEKKDSWTDSLHPETSWLDKRKTELGVEEKKTQTKKPFFFEVKSSIGGGTELEGASYFRFFTMLMLITAFIFVPFAYFYKEKTYLQS